MAALLAADTIPQDTYRDPGARALVERAVLARARDEDGISAFEGTVQEHLRIGISPLRFRRERTLFQSDRLARVRWERESGRTIQWIGKRDAVPLIGERARVFWSRDDGEGGGSISLGLSEPSENRSDSASLAIQEAIAGNLSPLVFTYRPGNDRLAFGDRFAVHPLGDSAPSYYRYRSGDTLRLSAPGEPDLVLVEILVQPRTASWELLSGSLWFDRATGALARAHYRPSTALDLKADEGEDVPGFLTPFRFELEYLTIEYSLHESEWWLPRRFATEGRVRAGRLLRGSFQADWIVRDYLVNTEESKLSANTNLPTGWLRESGDWVARDGTREEVVVVVPPLDTLESPASFAGAAEERPRVAFSEAELANIRRDLLQVLPTPPRGRYGLAYGFQDGNLRYNRVEGVGLGASTEIPITPRATLAPQLRVGLMDGQVRGSASLYRGREGQPVRGHRISKTYSHSRLRGSPLPGRFHFESDTSQLPFSLLRRNRERGLH